MTQWTKEPPSEPGWYWFRVNRAFSPTPFRLLKLQGGMRAKLDTDCWVHIKSWKGLWWPERLIVPDQGKGDG